MKLLAILPFLTVVAYAVPYPTSNSPDYRQALIRAQAKISRERSQNAQALTTSNVSTLHRPYQVGDSWDVLSWNWSDLTPSAGRGAVLHYEVTSISSPGQVVMNVTQRANVDPKVQSIQLTLQNLLYNSQREIHFQDRVVTLSGDTMPGNLSPLESYPFEFPDLRNAEKVNATPSAAGEHQEDYLKEITPEALTAAKKAGFQLDPAQSMRFESQDTFGRPVNVIWQRGDFWPTYVNTTHGFMFLLKNSTGAVTDQNSGT